MRYALTERSAISYEKLDYEPKKQTGRWIALGSLCKCICARARAHLCSWLCRSIGKAAPSVRYLRGRASYWKRADQYHTMRLLHAREPSRFSRKDGVHNVHKVEAEYGSDQRAVLQNQKAKRRA